LKLPFDIDFRALGHKLPHDFSEPPPGDDVVPFRAFLEFTVLILRALVGDKAELSNRDTVRCVLHFWILANVSDEDDFVYASRHFSPL
jgi:hypothetical protein